MSHRRLATGAAANIAAFLASLAVSFVLAPVVLRALGDARYGAWSYTESFVAYLMLFDLGVAAALVRFVPRSVARHDYAELNRVYSAAVIVFGVGAVLAVVIGTVFDHFFLDRCLAAAAHREEFRWIFRLLVLNFAVSLPLSVYPAVLDGLGRFSLKSAIRAATLLLRVPLTLVAIRQERPLVALGVVITLCSVLEHLAIMAAVMRLLPRLRFRPRRVERATFRSMAAYSGNAFFAMLAGRLSFHSDAFVIAPTLGAAAITLFSLPAKLVEMSKAVLRSGTTTLTPAFSRLEAQDDLVGLRTLFLTCTRTAWYTALPVQSGLLCLGRPFLRLWLGGDYAERCAPVLYVLASTASLTIAQSVASRVLYGTGRLRGFARATLAEGLTNLALSLVLVFPMGVVGVALGTSVPHAAFCLFVIATVCRYLQVGIGSYVTEMVRPAVAVVVPTGLWLTLAGQGIGSWVEFFAAGAAGCVAYAAVALALEWRRGVTRLLGISGLVPRLSRAAD